MFYKEHFEISNISVQTEPKNNLDLLRSGKLCSIFITTPETDLIKVKHTVT